MTNYQLGAPEIPLPAKATSALTLIEVLVVLAIIGVLAAVLLPALSNSKAKAHATGCLSNLKQLGLAMTLYTDDNREKLPYAALKLDDGTHLSWDDLIHDFIAVGRNTNSQQELRAGISPGTKVPRSLQCPSDIQSIPLRQDWRSAGGAKRSYAMPLHNMQRTNWPPGGGNSTGVGLFWDYTDFHNNFGFLGVVPPFTQMQGFQFNSQARNLAAVPFSSIPKPDSTLLLTEQARYDNLAGSRVFSAIHRADCHVQTSNIVWHGILYRGISSNYFQRGRITYLYGDGHTALLRPEMTVGTGTILNPKGAWTIKEGD